MAGDNRPEIEKVLAHYSQKPEDSLKYRAACFLIENMPGHLSYKDSAYYRKYYHEIDSVADTWKELGVGEKDSMYIGVMNKHQARPLESIEDIKIITAEYLVNNIEKAFGAWTESDWAKHVDFEQFCEYILPYKAVQYQELDNWRDYFELRFDKDLRRHEFCEQYKSSSYKACETVNAGIKDEVTVRLESKHNFFVRKMSTLTKVPLGYVMITIFWPYLS